MTIIGSLIFLLAAMLLAWRGLDGLPREKLVRYGLIWVLIIGGLALAIRMFGA